LVTDKIIGVVSFSFPNCTEPFKPSVMARVAACRDWIDLTLRKADVTIN
jgi:secreted trypsin-like serine protease